MMMLALAPRELITAWRAESVNSVIHVKDTSRAAGRVRRKTSLVGTARNGVGLS